MHIADGVVSIPVWLGSLGGTFGIAAAVLRRVETKMIPKIAVMTSAFFVASLIHIPLGPTSVHLTLSGLVGLVLGPAAFIAVMVGLVLQAVLFQHGGMTSIGINTLIMGMPAILVWWVFRWKQCISISKHGFLVGLVAGSISTTLSVIILALALIGTGPEFFGVAKYAVIAHIPVIVIEGLVTGSTISFLVRVKPEVLGLQRATPVAAQTGVGECKHRRSDLGKEEMT